MKTIHAEFNHARWIVICPNCAQDGVISASQVKPGDVFICSEEYPDLLAVTYVPNPRKQGALNVVADDGLREAARQTALAAGDAYSVIFPAEKAQIESVLRKRPRHARNWAQGTTLAELQQENAEHGAA